MSVRVVVADDQGMVRAGLRSLLEGEPDIDVVGEAADGNQALASVRRHRPDVVLMDIRMPNLDGLGAARQLFREGSPSRVLVLTTRSVALQCSASTLIRPCRIACMNAVWSRSA